MPNLNRVMLMGNLTRDIELKYTAGNQALANIGLAINRKYKTAAGEEREEVTFVDCEAWGKQAEVLAKYLSKGKPLYIEGRLKLDQWEKEGQKHSKLRVVLEGFQFIDSKGGGGSGGAGGGSDTSYSQDSSEGGGYQRSQPARSSAPAPKPSTGGHTPVGEEDIPF